MALRAIAPRLIIRVQGTHPESVREAVPQKVGPAGDSGYTDRWSLSFYICLVHSDC
ncbi:hypothetical protein NC796_12715 [Aliifodinibius sp. S!AR15-10]|uniref:hypothetical protein n=1 Tax=Aliifodinibius sp. S!AR15-10 TaxID=2950437 RepID=UPI0028558FA2|nr:hypothetical protein [Aliifodinibius sp. S!AR15-10]MDR8392011.1 hypothetical protein [Aliifodinibius sp. S!AR15-10]